MNYKKFIGCLLIIISAQFSQGTTIQKLTFEEMVAISELIIEARVIDSRPLVSDELIYTRILLKVDDVLKGDDPGEFVELDFLGGTEEGRTVNVSGQDIPLAGERGFYFIEELSMKAVNPLTGWSQGHFRIVTDAKGKEILETEPQQGAEELVELTTDKNTALASKLRNMKFNSKLVEQAYYTPATPDELRSAVLGTLYGE